MQQAPFSHIACCKLTQQIIPFCVNSNAARTATGTQSASTAKSGIPSLHFKKATNLALVLNFTETETPKVEWDLPAKAPWTLQALQELTTLTTLLQRDGHVEQLVCLQAELGKRQPTLPQILQTLTASFTCIPRTVCTNARTSAVHQIATCSLCVHRVQFTTAKAEVTSNKIYFLYSAYENIWH